MRRALFAVAAISSTMFFGAPAANADHVIDILSDGATCRAGGLATGIGVDLHTTRVHQQLHPDGWVQSYTCRFTDVPTYVSADQSMFGREWSLPKRKVRGELGCWRSQSGERVEGVGTWTLKPNATASVTCNFSQAPG